MKKILLILTMAVMATFAANAKSASQIRIYINPGHGAWTSEDRPMALVNKSSMDTTGFFESNTNLKVGFGMYEKLKEYGLTMPSSNALLAGGNNVVMSRVKNGPNTCPSGSTISSGGSTYGAYSRNLSEIAIECHTNNFDMFISPHSNAFADGQPVNYPLILYRGTDGNERSAGSIAMCQAMWPYAYSDAHQQWSATSTYSSTKPNIRGDVSFMGGDYSTTINGVAYWGYYGVLRQGTPGYLIERYFHTYQPARHRAMNWEACYIQGYLLARGVAAYWGLTPTTSTGEIFGVVRSATETFSHTYYNGMSGSDDQKLPLNGVKVTLKQNGNVVNTQQINQNGTGSTVSYKTTDNFYNGVFVFRGLAAGNYTVTLEKSGYTTKTINVTVTANQTTYPKVFMDVAGQQVDPYDPGTGYYNYYDDKMAGGWPLNPRLNYAEQPTVSSLDNRNSFAYDVATSLTTAGCKVRYRLAGVATAVTVRVYNSAGTQVATATGTRNPLNEVSVSLSGQPDGIYKAKVEVTSANHGWAAVGTRYRFMSPWGVTCNNCPESPSFGRVLCLESNVNTQTRTSTNPYHSGLGVTNSMTGSGNGMGIYAFTAQGLPMWHDAVAANPMYAPNTSTDTQRNYYSFRGGMGPVASTNAARQLDFKRIKYSDDGRLFLSRTNNDQTVATLYELNPNNLEETASPVFTGSIDAYGAVGGNTVGNSTGPSDSQFVANQFCGFDVFGNGPNLKIAAVGLNMTTGKTSQLGYEGVGLHYNTYNWANVSIYNLGTAKTWTSHPSQIVSCAGTWCDESANIAMNSNGVALTQRPRDNSGNLMTTGTSDKPNYSFYNTSMSRTANNYSIEHRGGGIAWNKDRTRLAMSSSNGDGKISIYTVNANGGLSEQTSFTIGGTTTYICAIAWDYADNIYVTSNMSEDLRCYSTPTVNGASSRTVTTPAAAYYDINWQHPAAYNPSANYYVADVNLQWTKSNTTFGNRSFGLSADQNSSDKYFYFLNQHYRNGTQVNGIDGIFTGRNCNSTNWTAAPSSNFSGEQYLIDYMATSDDAGNQLFFAVKHGTAVDDKEILASGMGQGSTRAIIIPNSGGGIKQTSVAANQSRTFEIGSTKITDRSQFAYATGDFSTAGGGNFWLLPYGGSTIYKGGFRNVSASGGERMAAKLIPTGLMNSNYSEAYLNSVTPYTDYLGNQRALVCLFGEGIYDGPITNDRFTPTLVSSTVRHAHGKPSMFMLQDRKLLVCSTGTDITGTMGLFEVSNDAAGVMTMTQVGSDFTPFSGQCNDVVKGTVTRVVPIDDLTADIYCSTGQRGQSVYRVRLEPEPVVTVSTQVVNYSTSQAKKITWTTKSGTSPVGFLIEASSDGGNTWVTISSPLPRQGSDSYSQEGDPNNTGSMREFIDTDVNRSIENCQYRISAIYDSFTSIARHTAVPKANTKAPVKPSKTVANLSLEYCPALVPSGYNSNGDLAGLEGELSFDRPKSIDSDASFYPAADYGYEIKEYYIYIKGSDGSYAKNAAGTNFNWTEMTAANSQTAFDCSTFASNRVTVPVKGLKRGVTYTIQVLPEYDYLPKSDEVYATEVTINPSNWNYTPNPVNSFKVENYVKRNAVVREHWQSDGQYHDVTYDIYQVHIFVNNPSAVYCTSNERIPVSYHKLEVSKDGGLTWGPVQDFVPQNNPQSTTYPYPAQANVPAGCFQGLNAFSSSKRTNPDGNFQYDVNVGFYHYVYKGNTIHSNQYSPKAVDYTSPENWQYRITTYYGASPSTAFASNSYSPTSYGLDQSAYADALVEPTQITGIDEIGRDDLFQVMVYPNPTQGAMNVQSPEPIQTIRIVSVAGALVKTINGSNGPSQSIDLGELSAGNYFLIVNNQKPVHIIKR